MRKGFKKGRHVLIERRKTQLVHRLGPETPGGWIVFPPIDGLRLWNEDAMTFIKARSTRCV